MRENVDTLTTSFNLSSIHKVTRIKVSPNLSPVTYHQVVSKFALGPGPRLLEEQMGVGGPTTTLVRTFYRDRMTADMEVNGVKASSIFLRN